MRLFRLLPIMFFSVTLLLAAVPAQAVDVALAWDPNTETDLKGYGVYFSQGIYGPPYQLAGYVELTDFDDPQAPTFTVTGLTAGTEYSLAVTAYDADGNESYYSSPVCVEAGVGPIQCASFSSSSSSDAPSSSGGGGGGGGGCFISTASGGFLF